MKSFFDMEMEFADACDIFKGKVDGFDGPTQEQAIGLAYKLVNEEVNTELLHVEVLNYLREPTLENKVLVADGIADSIYVLCQLARSMGIPLNEVYEEVHRTNMLKVGPLGKVIRREDGKIMKPNGWQPPDIWNILKAKGDEEAKKLGLHGAENWSNTAEVMQKHSGG